MANGKYIYVDTNLNTTAVVDASFSDTTFTIKEKLLAEHIRINPSIGRIQITALKAKRKGHLYTLPDTLPVTEMFRKSDKTWHLTADCVPFTQLTTKSNPLTDTTDTVKARRKKRRRFKPTRQGESSEPFVNAIQKEDELLVNDDKAIELSQGKTLDCSENEIEKKLTSVALDQSEATIVSEHKIADDIGRKKQRVKLAGINLEKPALDQANGANVFPVLHNFDMFEGVQRKIEIVDSKQAEKNSEEVKKSKKKTRKSRASASNAQEDFVKDQKNSVELPPVTEQTMEDDGTKKKNMENDAAFPVLEDEGDTTKKSKKKKKKSRNIESEVQENFPTGSANISSSEGVVKLTSGNECEINIVISQTKHTLEDDVPNKENIVNHADIPLLEKENAILESNQADKNNKDEGESSEPFVNAIEKEDELLINDDKATELSQGKTLDCSENEIEQKLTSVAPDQSEATIVWEHKIADDTGGKKRRVKLAGINLEKPALDQANGANVSLLHNFDISEGVQRQMEIVDSKQAEKTTEEVKKSKKKTRKSRASASNAQEDFVKDQKNSVELPPVTEQTMEDDGTKKKNMENDAAFPVLEDEGDATKKSKKKKKKSRVIESEVQENFPTGSANISSSEGVVKLTSGNECEINIVISQTKHTLEDDVPNKENIVNHADIPLLEKENAILESNQADKNNKDEGESSEPFVNAIEKEDELLINDDKAMELSQGKTLDCSENEIEKKLTSVAPDQSEATIWEHKIADDTGRKKRRVKLAGINLEKPALDEANGANVSLLHNFDISEGVQRQMDIVDSKQAEKTTEEVKKSKKKTRKSRASASNAQEDFFKDQKNIVELPPVSEETLEDDGTKKKNIENDAAFPVLKDEGDTTKISKKKKKKSRVIESEVQENFPTGGASITSSEGIVKLTSGNETEINIVIPQIKHTLEYDVPNKENNVNHADIPLLEKENAILESNQAEGEKGNKSNKKRKTSQVTESEETFPTKGSNITSSEENDKLPIVTENEATIVISQTEQNLECDGSVKENKIPESIQADKINKDEGVTGRKSGKKRKKCQASESDVQENFPASFGANEELPVGNENESKIAITEQALDDEGTKKKNMVSDADCLVSVKENAILDSNQADKNNKVEGEKGKKSDKKRKRSQVTESEETFLTEGSNITSSEENDKLPIVNENETTIVISQNEQNLEYDGSVKENKILESIQADKVNKDEGVTGRKSGKKRKKSQVSESDVQENFPASFGANEELPVGTENESKIAITEQALDDEGTKKKNMVSDADCLVSVKEKETVESNLADRNNEVKGDDNKSKKKIKKSQVTVSSVQKNFSVMDETTSAETKDNLVIKGAHVVTDEHGIDFKLHFVHKNLKPEVASDDNVKVTSQLNAEMETARNVKKDELSSLSALSDLPKSPRSSDKHDSENKSSLKEGARGMKIADSKLVLKTPQDKSLLIKPQSSIQDRSTNSMANKMMLIKTPETKNVFLKPGSVFKDRSFITNKMKLMKTPQKKNLFMKPGSVFQDNGVDDDMGDNGRTVTSDATTDDSSDISSESDNSEGESEMSNNLNGSDAGRRGIFDSGMLEMSKILRNSAQFKKAKLIASQTEIDLELVLTNQPEPQE